MKKCKELIIREEIVILMNKNFTIALIIEALLLQQKEVKDYEKYLKEIYSDEENEMNYGWFEIDYERLANDSLTGYSPRTMANYISKITKEYGKYLMVRKPSRNHPYYQKREHRINIKHMMLELESLGIENNLI